MNETQQTAVETFAALHKSGCFVIPNPWHAGSAKYLEHLGFKALATTSSGFAFSQGRPDTPSPESLPSVLAHFRDIVEATSLPVNADFQNGHADEPEGVAANVKLCVETGVAGLSIEDSWPNGATPLYDIQLAVERIKAARRAIDDSGVPVILTGRCEIYLTGDPNSFKVAMERLVAYSEAGADCLFAPGVADPREVEAMVKAVAPKAVNVLVSRPAPNVSVAALEDLGVRRISVGGALARVAWGAFMRAAQSIATTGSFDELGEGTAFAELNKLFRK